MPRKQKSANQAVPPWAMQAQPQLMTLYDAGGRAYVVDAHGAPPMAPHYRPVRIQGLTQRKGKGRGGDRSQRSSQAPSRRSSQAPSRRSSRAPSRAGSVAPGYDELARMLADLGAMDKQKAKRLPSEKLYDKILHVERAIRAGKGEVLGEKSRKQLAEIRGTLASLKEHHKTRTGMFYYTRRGEWPPELEPAKLPELAASAAPGLEVAETLKKARGKIRAVFAEEARAKRAELSRGRLKRTKRLAELNGMSADVLKPQRHHVSILEGLVSSGPVALRSVGDFALIASFLIEHHGLATEGATAESVLAALKTKAGTAFKPGGAVNAAELLSTPEAGEIVRKALRILKLRHARAAKKGNAAQVLPPAIAPRSAESAKDRLFSMRF